MYLGVDGSETKTALYAVQRHGQPLSNAAIDCLPAPVSCIALESSEALPEVL